MTIKYEAIELENGKTFIKRTDEAGESWIPSDPANSDYQAYLAANSTPSVAPVVTPADPVAATAAVVTPIP